MTPEQAHLLTALITETAVLADFLAVSKTLAGLQSFIVDSNWKTLKSFGINCGNFTVTDLTISELNSKRYRYQIESPHDMNDETYKVWHRGNKLS